MVRVLYHRVHQSSVSLMPFVYILYSQKLNKYYIGAAIDKEQRLVTQLTK